MKLFQNWWFVTWVLCCPNIWTCTCIRDRYLLGYIIGTKPEITYGLSLGISSFTRLGSCDGSVCWYIELTRMGTSWSNVSIKIKFLFERFFFFAARIELWTTRVSDSSTYLVLLPSSTLQNRVAGSSPKALYLGRGLPAIDLNVELFAFFLLLVFSVYFNTSRLSIWWVSVILIIHTWTVMAVKHRGESTRQIDRLD